MTRSVQRQWWIPTLLIAALIAAALMADRGGDGAGEVASQSRKAYRGLCDAVASAADDPARARTAFYDHAHDALHVLAEAVDETDRAKAGRLLEAKDFVEADMAQPEPPPRLASHLEALLAATEDAMGEVGIAAPPCDAQAIKSPRYGMA